MSAAVEENRRRLTEELKLDPENIGYATMSDEDVVKAMETHGVRTRLGFDIIRPDHIARFR